ncbi:SPC98 Spindle pole body component SPC98 [Candida maltosa Xu316]
MALNQEQIVKVYSNRLVKSLIPNEFGEVFIQSIINDLQSTLLNGPIQSHDLTNNLKNEWIEFQNVINSLSKFRSLDQICNYLVFLDALRSEPEQTTTSFIKPDDILSQSSYSQSPTRLQPVPPNPNTSSTTSQLTLFQLIEPYYFTLSEQTILTYLPYTLLGSDSKIFTFSNDFKRLEIPADINNSFSSLLRQIFEFALLYKQLILVVENLKGKLVSAIKTAYIAILERQLNEYVNDINQVFNSQPESILSVYNSIFPWIFKLRFLYRVSNKLNHVDGYDFLCYIYSYTKFGDSRIKKIATLAYEEVVKPYYNIIEHWIIKGELIDNNNEFFITFDTNSKEFNNIIKIIPKKIPEFIKSSDKIFQIGKTLIFLDKYCGELKWVNQYNLKFSTIIFNNYNGLSSMSTNEIVQLIDSQYQEILTYFTQIIQGNNNMFVHLCNCKKFYFMENNDFIDALIIKGQKVFDGSSADITSTYLRKVSQEAIQISSVKNFEYANRVDSRSLNPQYGSLGWETFSIDYKIDDLPMYSLFEGHQNAQYLKVFHFLWKLRHLNYLLVVNFELFNELNHNVVRNLPNRSKKMLNKSVTVITIIRNHFQKFLNGLIGYLSYEVIEESFEKNVVQKIFYNKNTQDLTLNKSFLPSVEDENDTVKFNVNLLNVDELVEMHGGYLNKIINSNLLNEKVKGKETNLSYIDQIYDILQTIFNFVKTSKEYYSLVVNFGLLSKLDKEKNFQLEQDEEDLEFQLHKVRSKIYKDIYSNEFQLQLNDFKDDLNTDYNLKDLSKMI